MTGDGTFYSPRWIQCQTMRSRELPLHNALFSKPSDHQVWRDLIARKSLTVVIVSLRRKDSRSRPRQNQCPNSFRPFSLFTPHIGGNNIMNLYFALLPSGLCGAHSIRACRLSGESSVVHQVFSCEAFLHLSLNNQRKIIQLPKRIIVYKIYPSTRNQKFPWSTSRTVSGTYTMSHLKSPYLVNVPNFMGQYHVLGMSRHMTCYVLYFSS